MFSNVFNDSFFPDNIIAYSFVPMKLPSQIRSGSNEFLRKGASQSAAELEDGVTATAHAWAAASLPLQMGDQPKETRRPFNKSKQSTGVGKTLHIGSPLLPTL